MKATGVVRRIDDLGRIVLPKELRRTMRIKEGEQLEIYIDGIDKIVLKKYSPVNQMTDFIKDFTDSIYSSNQRNIIITDNEQIVSASGDFKEQLVGKKITKDLEEKLKARQTQVVEKTNPLYICEDYHAKNLAGKKALFKVDIKELRKVVKPELNDEFAKSLGEENMEGITPYSFMV